MKERPILFNAEMVRAVLDRRKAQTRRVIKFKEGDFIKNISAARFWPVSDSRRHWMKCPYGIKGDRLWVRETFQLYHAENEIIYIASSAKGHECNTRHLDQDKYFADDWEKRKRKQGVVYHHRPSIHMPRWASRINLEITDIRVERVCDISWEDAVEEGIFQHYDFYEDSKWVDREMIIYDYRKLWDSINKKRGFGWDVNPYVWIIEFKLLKS